MTRTLLLPEAIANITHLVCLPRSNEMALIALHSVEDTLCSDVFRTEGDNIRQLTKTGDVVGIGSVNERGHLLWARSWSDSHGIKMALYRYDPTADSVTHLPFPEKHWLVHPERGSTSSVESVIFASNTKRMAVVVQTVTKSEQKEEQTHLRQTCYSVESDGSGQCFIRQTEPEGGNLYPAWSRDGQRLVILDSSSETPSLFVYNYDGTGKRMAPLPTEQAEASVTR